MSCFFGLLGAQVIGLEIEGKDMSSPRAEAKKWGVHGNVTFLTYDGNSCNIPGGPYDYIFTKSVMVALRNPEIFLAGLVDKLTSGGELLLTENLPLGIVASRIRQESSNLLVYKHLSKISNPYLGVSQKFLDLLKRHFRISEIKKYYGLVATIRATQKLKNICCEFYDN